MSNDIKIIAGNNKGDKAQTNVGLRKSELDFLYDLVVGKATVKAKMVVLSVFLLSLYKANFTVMKRL